MQTRSVTRENLYCRQLTGRVISISAMNCPERLVSKLSAMG